MSSQTIESLEVLIDRPEELYDLLNEAEALLRQAATAHGFAGIRVTRHDPARYTFELSDTVPFGETWDPATPRAIRIELKSGKFQPEYAG